MSCYGKVFTVAHKNGEAVCGNNGCGSGAPYVGLNTFGCSGNVHAWGGKCCDRNNCDPPGTPAPPAGRCQSAAGWPCGGDIAAPPLGTIAPPPPPQPPAAAASAHHSIVGGGDATPAGVAGDTIGGGDTWLGLGLGLGVGMGLRSGLGLGLGLGVGLGLGLGAVPQTSAAPCSEGSLLSGGWLSPLLVSGIALWRSAVPEVSES